MSGKGSSFPLTRLASKYLEARSDGRILSNRESINIIDDRVVQLLERVDVDEAPERIVALYNLWTEYQELRRDGKAVKANLVADQIDEVFDKVYHDYKAWEQIFTALDIRRKHVESEVKILHEIHAVMTAEDAYQMVAKLMAAVISAVEDPKTIRRIQHEFVTITGEVSDEARSRLEREADSSSGEDRDSE